MSVRSAGVASDTAYRVVGPVPTGIEPLSTEKKRLREIIRQKSLLTQHTFKLASGGMSNYYFDMKAAMFDPEGAALIAEIIYDLLRREGDAVSIGGLELGAVPIIASVCARSWPDCPINGFVVRKETKGHGTDQRIDGNFNPNSTVVLFEDVTTKGGSVLQAVRAVRERGARVKKVITIVDRLEGATENLQKEGLELLPIFTTRDFHADQASG
jgi:orotate phosphoribosyltransferase